MKYPFKSLLLAATVLAAASCAKDDTQSGGEETAGPVIVNASPAAIGGEVNTFSRKHQKSWSAPAKYAVCLILLDK